MKIHLQGIGKMDAIKASELKEGMITIWNYGYTEIVKSIQPTKSGKSLKIVIICENGEELTRTMRNDRLIAVQ